LPPEDQQRFEDRLRHAQTFMDAAVQALEEAAELSTDQSVQGHRALGSNETVDLVYDTSRQVKKGCERIEQLLAEMLDGDHAQR
jgi:hypothetical protein